MASRARRIKARGHQIGRDVAKLDVAWARSLPVRIAREGFLAWMLSPAMSLYTRRCAKRREVLTRLRGPVVFVANHSSHLDTPVILRALPHRWRSRTAVAAAADYFYRKRRIAIPVSMIFGTVPIARCGGAAGRESLEHLDRLMGKRWNVLMFPEGTRSRDGGVGRLRSGAVLLAARRRVPIIPIAVSGTNQAMPPGRSWPRRLRQGRRSRRHSVEVTFGDPILVEDHADIEAVKDRVHAFFERHDAGDGEPAVAAARAMADRVGLRPPGEGQGAGGTAVLSATEPARFVVEVDAELGPRADPRGPRVRRDAPDDADSLKQVG